MGVPVFNALIGICAGAYMGRRLYLQGITTQEYGADLKKTGIFSAIIMIFICMLSAYFALKDPYTAANLEGMFNTSFQITNEMIYGLVIVGGIGLIIFQYFSTIVAGRIAYKMGRAA